MPCPRSPNSHCLRHERFDVECLTQSWKLISTAVLKLAGFAGAFDELAVLFDATDRGTTSVCLYELKRIHGSCADTAMQLALDFAVVVDKAIGDDAAADVKCFEISAPERPRQLGETLALTGGPRGGDWKCAATSLQIGATVVQAQQGRGEPCANCTCGGHAAMG